MQALTKHPERCEELARAECDVVVQKIRSIGVSEFNFRPSVFLSTLECELDFCLKQQPIVHLPQNDGRKSRRECRVVVLGVTESGKCETGQMKTGVAGFQFLQRAFKSVHPQSSLSKSLTGCLGRRVRLTRARGDVGFEIHDLLNQLVILCAGNRICLRLLSKCAS